jgi:hypothetical protein
MTRPTSCKLVSDLLFVDFAADEVNNYYEGDDGGDMGGDDGGGE